MIGMMVSQQHAQHRLAGGFLDALAQRLAVATRRAGVDHHHTVRGIDETDVDDIAAVFRREIICAAFQQPDTVSDLPGLQVVIKRLGKAGTKSQQKNYPAHAFFLEICLSRELRPEAGLLQTGRSLLLLVGAAPRGE